MSLPFGRKIKTRHFYILKTSKSLSKREVASLRNGIPAEISKHLQRGSLPYIKVSTISEIWAVEFAVGTSMFEAIDDLTPIQGADGLELTGNEADTADVLFQIMFADTTLLGDEEYLNGKLRLRDEFIRREAAGRNAANDEGKTDEQLRKESDEAVQEVIDRENHAATLTEMGEQLKKEESEVGDDKQH